jgi:hypothetical protein
VIVEERASNGEILDGFGVENYRDFWRPVTRVMGSVCEGGSHVGCGGVSLDEHGKRDMLVVLVY